MKTRDDIERLLALNGFTLKRDKKHLIYSNGKVQMTISKSESCHRAMQNNFSVLRRLVTQSGDEFIEEEPREPRKEKMQTMTFNPPRTTMMPPTPTANRPTPRATPITPPTPVANTEKPLDAAALEKAQRWFNEGRKQNWIHEALEALGYCNIGGGKLDQSAISKWMRANGMQYRETQPKKPKAEAAPANAHPLLHQLTELLSSNMSDAMKEELIIMLVKKAIGAE